MIAVTVHSEPAHQISGLPSDVIAATHCESGANEHSPGCPDSFSQ